MGNDMVCLWVSQKIYVKNAVYLLAAYLLPCSYVCIEEYSE